MTQVREQKKLTWGGGLPAMLGIVAWWIGMTTASPGVVLVGQTFLAVGFGLIAGGTAQGLAAGRGRRLPVLGVVAIGVVVAVATVYVTAAIAPTMLR